MKYFDLKTSSIKDLPGRRMWMLYNTEEHGAEAISVSYIEIPGKQAALPFHKHDTSLEFIFISNGSGHIEIEGKKIILSRGSAILVEKGEEHALFNDSEEPLCAVCTFSPPTAPKNYLNGIQKEEE
jgi:mannose-6-phosphate isomerase-like protein (cupin superfamily)